MDELVVASRPRVAVDSGYCTRKALTGQLQVEKENTVHRISCNLSLNHYFFVCEASHISTEHGVQLSARSKSK